MRTAYDVLAVFIVGVIALLVASIAHAETGPSEVVLQTLCMESANQQDLGMAWVARTLIVRAKNKGTNPEIEALRRKQYSCWNDPKSANAWLRVHYTQKVRQRALNAYKMACSMSVNPTHYHTLSVRPYWSKGKKPLAVIGAHSFYNNIK